jgi:excinuclease UvrABC nuclease subunit
VEIEGFTSAGQILRSGVYILVHRGVIVYIGKSKSMLGRIYAHRSMWGTKAKRRVDYLPKGILFDDVFIRPCPVDLLDELEFEMINIYKPRLNIKLKTPGASDRPFSLNVNGTELKLNSKEEITRRL